MGMLGDPAVLRATKTLWPARGDDDRAVCAARAAWTAIAEPGDGIAGALIAAAGPATALRAIESPSSDTETLFSDAGVSASDAAAARARWRPRGRPDRLAEVLTAASQHDLELISPEDPSWPVALHDLGAHAPVALWLRGRPEALTQLARSVSIVGARAATAYGEHVAGELAAGCAERTIAVISGGAYGIDGAAHRATLGAGGVTIAVGAGGADRVYPAGHAHLFAEIARDGAVLSEVSPSTVPTKWRFLQRNRLIAALSGATIVVEAGVRSGSLNTAGHAATLGRPLGAVPGTVTSASSAGCHRLLREFDATCITDVADVAELLGDTAPEVSILIEGLTSAQMRVRDALDFRRPRDLAEIVESVGLSAAETAAALGSLELSGQAHRSDAGWTIEERSPR